MTQVEYEAIRESFERTTTLFEQETSRYEALRPGQIIYVYDGWDNFKHEVVSVDVPGRLIYCLDHSLKALPTTITHGCWDAQPHPTM